MPTQDVEKGDHETDEPQDDEPVCAGLARGKPENQWLIEKIFSKIQ